VEIDQAVGPMPLRTIGRVRRALRRHGFVGAVRHRLRYWNERYGYYDNVFSIAALQLAEFKPRYAGRTGAYELLEIAPGPTLPAFGPGLGEVIERLQRYDLLRQWLDEGDTCFLALKGGDVLGYMTLMRVRYFDDWGLTVDLAPGQCKIRDVFVAPQYRRTVVGGLLHDAVLQYAQRNGFQTILGSVNRRNRPSLRNCMLNGYREMRRVRCRRFFRSLFWVSEIWAAATPDQWRELSHT
jgi:GNAT superfamily N-acetyltransferase